jgi:sec-independent protein translocase protein TatC
MAKARGRSMPLIDHVREFRNRFLKSLLAISILSIVGWIFYEEIITELVRPFCDLDVTAQNSENHCGDLYINGLIGPFNLHIKVAFISGVILSAPLWLYQIWAFFTPALHKREKRIAIFFVMCATPLFILGSFCAYLLLPHAVEVLLGFTPNDLGNLVRFDEYLDFVMRLILLFGIAFVLPLFLLLLNLIGLISGKSILKPWRFAVFLIFLFTAAFTPTPDPITMTVLAIPICLLYFLSGTTALILDKRKSKKDDIPDDSASNIAKPESI